MICADRLSYSIGDFRLRQLSLEVADGQYFVLLGPPGAGKTILLECLCGLKRISSGRILMDERDVTSFEPRARGIGYVPQDYALFPHLSVERNIAFGLRTRGIGLVPKARRARREEICTKVALIAEMLDITHLLKRNVAGLSGGEKQRAALARALVMEPKVLLLDEPVCALDEGTRQSVCAMLHRVQRKLELTVIHVSHNLEEAFSVADRAAVLNRGVLEQVGSLDDLLRRPNNEFIARFMRCENILSDDVDLHVPGSHRGKIKMMIRPEDVLVLPLSKGNSKNQNEFRVNLVRWRDYGGYVRVELQGPVNLVAHVTQAAFAELQAEADSELIAVLRPENIHVLPG